MPRLYDTMRRKSKKIATLSAQGRAFGLQDLEQLPTMPVVVVDEAVRYFYEMARKDGWRTGEEIMPFIPMFETFWMETRAPTAIVDSKGNDLGVDNGEVPRQWGVVVRCEDHKKARAASADDYQRTAAKSLENVFRSAGYDLTIATGVRWTVTFNLYLEDSPLTREARLNAPLGPYVHMMMGLQENGELAEFDNGERVRVPLPLLSDRFKRDPEAMRVHSVNAAWLINPMCFALFLANCKDVTLADDGPSQKNRKKAENNYGIPTTRYKTLNIEPMKQVFADAARSAGNGQSRAFHWVRAHTHVYLPERGGPFGRKIDKPEIHVIPSHSRGNPEHGSVEKDYAIDTPTSEPTRDPRTDT